MTPVRSGDRIKTDRRDARNLAGLFRSGLLTAVHVPDETTEAMRDLTRAREAARNAERAARHQLGKFLLRHGRTFAGGKSWTKKHLEWIGRQRFDHEAQRRVLADCLHAVEEAGAREARLAADLAELSETWCKEPLVDALMGFRGIQRVTAVTLVAELDDLLRFAGPRGLMAYLGLVPSERSSGRTTRRGSITKAGNGHVRRGAGGVGVGVSIPAADEPGDRPAQRGPDAPAAGDRLGRAGAPSRAVRAAEGPGQERAANGHGDRAGAGGLRLGDGADGPGRALDAAAGDGVRPGRRKGADGKSVE